MQLNKIFISILLLSLYNTSNLFAQPDTGIAGKGTCYCNPAPLVLIPAGSATRVGWLNIGVTPTTSYPPTVTPFSYQLIENVSTATGLYTQRVINPSGIGGLPVNFGGFPGSGPTALSGIAEVFSGSLPAGSKSIYVSGTMTIGSSTNHYILRADMIPPSPDFIVSGVYNIAASFAPASAGWMIKKIEMDNSSVIWALFSNVSGSATYLAFIDLSTNTAYSWASFPSTCYNGLDIGYDGYAYLLNTGASTITKTPLPGCVGCSTSTISLPTSSPCGMLNAVNSFLIMGYYGVTSYYTTSGLFHSTSSTPVSNTLTTLLDMGPGTSGTMAIPGVLLPDCTAP